MAWLSRCRPRGHSEDWLRQGSHRFLVAPECRGARSRERTRRTRRRPSAMCDPVDEMTTRSSHARAGTSRLGSSDLQSNSRACRATTLCSSKADPIAPRPDRPRPKSGQRPTPRSRLKLTSRLSPPLIFVSRPPTERHATLPQQCLNLRPLPQTHGSFRPTWSFRLRSSCARANCITLAGARSNCNSFAMKRI